MKFIINEGSLSDKQHEKYFFNSLRYASLFMGMINNEFLKDVAVNIKNKLKNVIDHL